MQVISQVLTFANWRGSSSCGRIVPAAGAEIARDAPNSTSIAKTSSTGPCCQESSASPTEASPVSAAARIERLRRG